MPYQPPVRIRTADDLPRAIQWAGEDAKNRWYVMRMAKAFDKADLIPEDWDPDTAPAATRRITSEQANIDSAMIDNAVDSGDVPADAPGETGEGITAAIGRRRRTQKIQTEAGVKRYGAPIGTPIIKKDGKLVADLKHAVRLDGQGKIAEAHPPANKLRSIAIDKIEEGDEIIGKSGRELVVISNKQGEGYHYELKTSDAEGKRFDFSVPPTGRIRLIEDDNELDDDDERPTPAPVDPAHVLESKAALKAARQALRRGEKGVTPQSVAAARKKATDAEAQLETQMRAPAGDKLERADKTKKPKPPTPEEADLPEPASDDTVDPPKTPVSDPPKSDQSPDDISDWGDAADSRGNALVPGAEYRINRPTGKLWVIDSRNEDGTFRLKAASGATGGRDTRSRVDASSLVAVDAPEPEPAPTVEKPPVTDADLAGLKKDSKRRPLKLGQGYKISQRGTVTWEIDSVNPDGTLELRPTGDTHGGRRRHNVKPNKMIPVDAPAAAETPEPPKGDRKSKLAEMQAKVDAAPAPEDGARDALQRDLDTMAALHKELFDVEQEMVRARRLNAWGEERAEIQTRIDKAQKNFLMAKRDVKTSRSAASAYGIDLPDPPDPSLPRIVPPQERVRATRRPTPEVVDWRSTDPQYFADLDNRQLAEAERWAKATQYGKPIGSPETLAIIDAELRKRDEQWYGPRLDEKSEEELHDLLDAAGAESNSEEIERIMKELDRREEEDKLANSDDVWERIGMRVANGTNPMQAESEETGRDLDSIIRRESLRYMREHYSLPDGVAYERALGHAYTFEIEADMRRAEDEVRGGEFLSPAGRRAGVTPIELWTTRSERRIEEYASDELKAYWDDHGGRITRATLKERIKNAIGAPGAGSGQNSTGGAGGFLR